MKILQLCSKPPFPTTDGGTLAINAITKELIRSNHQVKVFAISTFKHPFKPNSKNKQYIIDTSFEHQFIDTQIKPIGIISSFFKTSSYNIDRFYMDKKYNKT